MPVSGEYTEWKVGGAIKIMILSHALHPMETVDGDSPYIIKVEK